MKKYDYKTAELKYQKKWDTEQTYVYKKSSSQKNFVIDTPPPTVSGSLHIGHIFSYTQTDIIARFKRMSGFNVFYPMGFDDNGLPTEKRVQNLYGIACDPHKDYEDHLNLQPLKQTKSSKRREYQTVSRKNFLEICHRQVLEDEKKYKKLWNHISLSVDWSQTYQSIGPKAQALSQHSFLDLYHKKAVENRLSPVLWDTQFQTAVAQADVEDREKNTFYNDILFEVEQGGHFTISTTRPELLPACVAVAAHPDDKRYQKFFNQHAITALFKRRVPILPSLHADPEKGTGILMVCTFGDMEDVHFCQKQKLETLQLIDEQGFLKEIDFEKAPFLSQNPSLAKSYYDHLKGLRVQQARKKIIEILRETKVLQAEPKPSKHHVKFYEKGDFPLEILPKRQWYIKILEHKETFLNLADQINWHPPALKNRYRQWVEGLNQDWCISRQRAYGVPFPVWYPLDEKSRANYQSPLLPKQIQQAIDPMKQFPEGFREEQRGQAKGFIEDADVMDTWATSSLTPFISSSWIFDKEKHKDLFPADLRPQSHEIIRTWAFYTLVKAYFHEKTIPWKNIAISGWVMTPNKEKMSKSKENAFSPEKLLESYSADAIRYWAAKAGLAQDTVFDENLFKIGKRLSTKIFNASQFVQLQFKEREAKDQAWSGLESAFKKITQPIDQAWLLSLLESQKQALDFFEKYEHQKALNLIEKQFWLFCDDYLELVKARAYKLKDLEEGLSALHSLDISLFLFLKLFAPVLPYVTEEIWQSRYSSEAQSLHQSLYLTKQALSNWLENLQSNWLETKKSYQSLFQTQTEVQDKVFESIKQEGDKLKLNSLLETAFSLLREMRKSKSSQGKSLVASIKKLEWNATLSQALSLVFYQEDLSRACVLESKSLSLHLRLNPEQSKTLKEPDLLKTNLESYLNLKKEKTIPDKALKESCHKVLSITDKATEEKKLIEKIEF